ncbi:hypothetical protein HAX54_013817 [Datura stramonium]|uniref:Uncharacterized protein n=1 Tax=Datura stramonium TaxID=4076 RepID=A0ABS8TNR8_DATST|nr:hypothetical protein [Datura stramonium]
MLIALTTKNKVGFIDETFPKSVPETVLGKTWSRANNMLLVFRDFDWATCSDSLRSVSDFISLDGSPISGKSKKQASLSLSSVEAEISLDASHHSRSYLAYFPVRLSLYLIFSPNTSLFR